MDYKYIEQLLERYWEGSTSLEEESILRAFFSQENIPTDLLPYRPIFTFQAEEKGSEVLGDDFDEKILALTEDPKKVKAQVITMRQRLSPIFKAAAMVAILLTLGNAIQVPFNDETAQPATNMAEYGSRNNGPSVAKADTVKADTLPQIMPATETVILK